MSCTHACSPFVDVRSGLAMMIESESVATMTRTQRARRGRVSMCTHVCCARLCVQQLLHDARRSAALCQSIAIHPLLRSRNCAHAILELIDPQYNFELMLIRCVCFDVTRSATTVCDHTFRIRKLQACLPALRTPPTPLAQHTVEPPVGVDKNRANPAFQLRV